MPGFALAKQLHESRLDLTLISGMLIFLKRNLAPESACPLSPAAPSSSPDPVITQRTGQPHDFQRADNWTYLVLRDALRSYPAHEPLLGGDARRVLSGRCTRDGRGDERALVSKVVEEGGVVRAREEDERPALILRLVLRRGSVCSRSACQVLCGTECMEDAHDTMDV